VCLPNLGLPILMTHEDKTWLDLARLGSILFGIDVVSSLHHPISYNFSVESKGEGGVHESDSRDHATFWSRPSCLTRV
jgi:hypothetical protein